MKTKIGLILFCILASAAYASYAPRPHVDQGLFDQRLPRQLVMVGDANKVVFYSKNDSGDWLWWSMRAADTIVIDANYVWPDEPNDVNSVLYIKQIDGTDYILDWGPFDANAIIYDVNGEEFTFPDKTPWNVIFVDANGFPITDDPNHFTYYQPSGYFGVGTDYITGQTYANNYIQVYTLLDFEPNLFNVSIGRGSDDTATGPNNVTIGYGAGNSLNEGYENTLGGNYAGQWLADSNDNTGWGYKVIGGLNSNAGIAEYPTLQELTAGEIPSAPSEPSVTSADTAVSNAAELQAMNGSNKYYLTTNIDLDGESWTPIVDFNGVLDGRDYTISNLTISSAGSDRQALFGTVGDGVEIYDVNLDGFNITGDSYVAALIAQHNAEGAITIKDVNITDCNLTGDNYVAPVIGAAWEFTDGDIYNVHVTGLSLSASGNSCGGFTGDIDLDSSKATDELNITNCSTAGTIVFDGSDSGEYCGGFGGIIIGNNTYDIVLHTCSSNVGLSWVDSGTPQWVGGFVGDAGNTDHISCSAAGDIDIDITNAPSTITGIGGYVGFEESTSTRYIDCHSTSTITIDAAGKSTLSLIGGFGGKWDVNSDVTRCYATGDITITGIDDTITWYGIGGFIGGYLSSYTSSNAVLQRSWADGDITLNHEGIPNVSKKGGLGGFIGELNHAGTNPSNVELTIQNCYAWGSVLITTIPGTYATAVSGFVGSIDYGGDNADTINFLNCYDAQTDTKEGSGYSNQIPEVSDANGLVGWVEDDMTVTEVNEPSLFWDTETSGILTDDYAEGHETDWMQTKANYQAAGWNFDTIWYMPENVAPDVHRVTALGAYAAARVMEGADDGLYLGSYSGAHNETDPNRFFLDELDRGSYLAEKEHGMMYGYFAEDPNDQWLTINVGELNLDFARLDVNDVNIANELYVADDANIVGDLTIGGDLSVSGTSDFNDVNIAGTFTVPGSLDVNDVNVTGTLTSTDFADFNDVNIAGDLELTNETASRLLATDLDKIIESTDASDWIDGTNNQITVTDDGDGTVTLSTPQDIHTGASPTFNGIILTEKSADPTKPQEGQTYIWMSDGTGYGDDGDVIIAATAGGVTRRVILFNFNMGDVWP